MPRRRLPNDKSRAWKCPRSLTLRCAGGVATCMDEWECLDRIQARGDLHTPGRSPDEALGIAAFAAIEHPASHGHRLHGHRRGALHDPHEQQQHGQYQCRKWLRVTTVAAPKVAVTDYSVATSRFISDAHGEFSANAKGTATRMASIHHRRSTCEL